MNPDIEGINRSLDICIVTYNPSYFLFEDIIKKCVYLRKDSCIQPHFRIFDNSITNQTKEIEEIIRKHISAEFITILRDKKNIGYGNAINHLIDNKNSSRYALILNQDAVPVDDAIKKSIEIVNNSDRLVVAWEFRQFPFEHPKIYNPVTLEAEWISGAAFIIKKKAFLECDGFEKRIFMYAEDVDLSFKLRAKGYKLRYMPDCKVLHYPFNKEGETKSLQAIEGRLNHLLLRAKYGSWIDILCGFSRYFVEMPFRIYKREPIKPLNTLYRAFYNFLYFRKSGNACRTMLNVKFQGWNFCLHRIGANIRATNINLSTIKLPLVSIIIRTHKRPGFVNEALSTVKNQTYPNIEVVVIEDGEAQSQQVINNYRKEFTNIIYHATHKHLGRSLAGNLGLSIAKGDWIGFLDDDDQLFADHIETLIGLILQRSELVCYGFAIEARTSIKDSATPRYNEYRLYNKYTQVFSRVLLWYKNYLPIQSVLFHRSLYEKLGGFSENLDHYEDWNLWVKYSTATDFAFIGKTTSKYRIPADKCIAFSRNNTFRSAYKNAQLEQVWSLYPISPINFRQMVVEYIKYRGVICITKDSILDFLNHLKSNLTIF